ncbi:L-histidine N(alpha)-methyltransferase [Uliginosibacterium sp. H3]|uniref:L-histidine N(Alpha)-methyltransferase n=1 Tax=Uliginosibacterium silvisoli TaxID=3114758 RepID=A0ABU6K1Y9_9RHOO|nr:L-histidine N(alpha)-methyltransferase [Uliginosibacterium sp. H3]
MISVASNAVPMFPSLVADDDPSEFAQELAAGLRARPRQVSPKFFYDATGSALFDQICELPEYYPTRTELAILQEHAADMAGLIGANAEIIEYGAGASRKVRLLLDALERPQRFVPIDISGEHLHASAAVLRADYPALDVRPVVADFTRPVALPPRLPGHGRRVGFFPGSSIGNFDPAEARRFLRLLAGQLRGGGLLIGTDLVKDPLTLHAAYNDAAGVTAAFNRNLLVRANRELDAGFRVNDFAHYAFYNPQQQRIEMHLVSRCAQQVRIADERFDFAAGDAIHTENSYKFTVEGFQALAAEVGFRARASWFDAQRWFCMHWLEAPA